MTLIIGWVLFLRLLSICSSTTLRLDIVHINNINGYFEESNLKSEPCNTTECFGGIGRIVGQVKKIRASETKDKRVLFLLGGNIVKGMYWYDTKVTDIIPLVMKHLQPNVTSFDVRDLEPSTLNALLATNATFVASNLDFGKRRGVRPRPSVLLQAGSVKVGVVGYLTTGAWRGRTPTSATVLDAVASLRTEVGRLRKRGAAVVIALGMALAAETVLLVRRSEGVDLFVGVSDARLFWNNGPPSSEQVAGKYPIAIRDRHRRLVPLAAAGINSKYLGHLRLVLNPNGSIKNYYGNPILLDNSIGQDNEWMEEFKKYTDIRHKYENVELGQSAVRMVNAKCRMKECALGNALADALVEHRLLQQRQQHYWTDAAIALLRSDALQGSLAARGVTEAALMRVRPYRDRLHLVAGRGRDLLQLLERAFSNEYVRQPEQVVFLQVSGLRMTVDLRAPSGGRVLQLQALCTACGVPRYRPVRPDHNYYIVTLDVKQSAGASSRLFANLTFLADIGDEYDAYRNYFAAHQLIYQEEASRIVVIPSHAIITATLSIICLLLTSCSF